MNRHQGQYPSYKSLHLVITATAAVVILLSWTVDETRADSNAFLINDTPSKVSFLGNDGERPLPLGSESDEDEERMSKYLSKTDLLVPDGLGEPEETKRGARGSFRSDLGKRGHDASSSEDESVDEDGLDESPEALKRYSGFRSDLGKRYSKFRNDLGKRRPGGRVSNYRSDLGKRAPASSTTNLASGSAGSDDENNATSNVQNQSEEEVTWKRAMFRSDLGKRLRIDAARRVFRADLGKRRMFRNDLG